MKLKTTTNMKIRLIVILTFYTFLIIFIASYFLKFEQREIKSERYNYLKAIAELKTSQLVKWHSERLSEVVFFSNNEPLIESILKLINGDASSEEYIRISLDHILSNNRYQNIFILNPTGEIVFNLDSNLSFVETTTLSMSKKTIENVEISFTDFYKCSTHNSIHYDIIAPILNAKGEVFATLVFRVNPEDYLFPLIQNWPTPSKTAETLLVRENADSVLFLNTLRHVNYPPLTFKIPLSIKNLPAVNAVLGLEGIYEGVDYRGHKVLSALSSVPNTPWFMVAKVDKTEIFKVLYYRTGFIIAITVLLIIVAGALLAWFYHYRQRNIFKQLLESERELHKSQEEFRATLYSIGDGVITTDNKGFVRQLNPVAEELTGWKEVDAKGKSLEDVFKIINEETRAKVESPVTKVLSEGAIVGLANHTLLISKSGIEIPIADSGAPIKNEKGEIEGVVMVFRDQSSEKQYIKNLEESEKRFKSIFEIASLGIVQVDPSDGKILTINKHYEKITGYSVDELLEMSFTDLTHPDDRKLDWEIFSKAVKGDGEYRNEKRYIKKDGTVVWVRLHVAFVRDNNGKPIRTVAVCEDVTMQKEAEQSLLESLSQVKLMQNALDKISTCVYMKDMESRYTFGNQATLELFGCKLDELVGREDSDFFSPETVESIINIDKRVFEGEQTHEEVSTINSRGDKSIYLELKTPIFSETEKDKICGLLGISTDITKLKETERAIALTNQQLKFHIENSPLAVIEWDKNFRVKRWTSRAEEFFGWTESEVLNKYPTDWKLIHEEDEQNINHVMGELLNGEVTKNISSNRNYTKDGKIKHCVWFNSVLRDENGESLSILSLVHNISEQILSEEKVKILNNQLRYLIKTLGQLSNASKLDEINQIISSAARELVKSDGCTFVLKDGDYCHYVNEDAISPLWKGKRFLLADCISGWVMLNKQTVIVPDIFKDDRIPIEAYKPTFVKSLVMVPLNSTKPFGAIGNYWAKEYSPTDEEVRLIETLADAASRVFENLQLYEELEQRVKEKTMELRERVSDLERFHEATIDRELRIKELRNEIERIKGAV